MKNNQASNCASVCNSISLLKDMGTMRVHCSPIRDKQFNHHVGSRHKGWKEEQRTKKLLILNHFSLITKATHFEKQSLLIVWYIIEISAKKEVWELSCTAELLKMPFSHRNIAPQEDKPGLPFESLFDFCFTIHITVCAMKALECWSVPFKNLQCRFSIFHNPLVMNWWIKQRFRI